MKTLEVSTLIEQQENEISNFTYAGVIDMDKSEIKALLHTAAMMADDGEQLCFDNGHQDDVHVFTSYFDQFDSLVRSLDVDILVANYRNALRFILKGFYKDYSLIAYCSN